MRKIIASVLNVIMLCCCMSFNVLAEDNTVTISSITINAAKDTLIVGGDDQKSAGWTLTAEVELSEGEHDKFRYQWYVTPDSGGGAKLKTETNKSIILGNDNSFYKTFKVEVTPIDDDGNAIGETKSASKYVDAGLFKFARRNIVSSGDDINNYLNTNPDNVFAVEDKKFILLDEFYSADQSFYILCDDIYGKRVFDTGFTEEPNQSLMFATSAGNYSSGEGNIAYWLNNDFLENGNGQMMLPKEIIDNLAEHKYHSAQNKDWKDSRITLKVALLGRADFVKYFGKFGIGGLAAGDYWWLRDSQGSADNASNYGPIAVMGKWNILEGTSNTAASCGVRPAFYMKENFFKTVKIDLSAAGKNVKAMLMERYGEDQLMELYEAWELAAAGMIKSPEAKDLKLYGKVNASNSISADYVYYHESGKTEADTVYGFEMSDSKDGGFTQVSEGTKEYVIPEDAAGKYIRFFVTPKDELGVVGDTVYSSVVRIGKKTDISVKESKITDSKGNDIAKLAAADEINADLTLQNETDTDKEVVVLCGIYDKDDKLLANCAEKVTVPAAGTAVSALINVKNPKYEEGNYAKIIVWDSLIGMKSYYCREIR